MAEADPRYPLRYAHDWVADLIGAIDPSALHAPTPCEGWDVTQLLAHLTGGALRLRTAGVGQPADPDPAPDAASTPQEWWEAYHQAVEDAWRVWDDDELLESKVSSPWGEIPGAQLLQSLTVEVVAHGWDLAVATGQPAEAPPQAAQAALECARESVPAARESLPFAPPVEPGPEAGPTQQLAAWLGRAVPAAS